MEKLKPISIRNVPASLWNRFVRHCKKNGRSIPFVFVQMIAEYLENEGA